MNEKLYNALSQYVLSALGEDPTNEEIKAQYRPVFETVLKDDKFVEAFTSNPEEAATALAQEIVKYQENAASQQEAIMAKKGARLMKLKKGGKKKCACGCELVEKKEAGGKVSSVCSCGCGGKVKLQEGGNVDISIVDYLKYKGEKFDPASRKKLAERFGINDYTGTPDQNTYLLHLIKKESLNNKVKTISENGEPIVVTGKRIDPTKIKVGSPEYSKLSPEGKKKAFNAQVTSGISDFGKKYTTPAMAGIVGAVGASTLAPIVAPALLPVTSEAMTAGKVGAQIIGKGLQQAGEQAATNPYGFLGGVAGSLYLGDRVNKEVQKDSEGKYNT